MEYLSDIKIAGINRKQVVTRYHDFKLPKYEKDGKTPLASSVETSKFTVQYYLRCFVKHSSIFEHGQGNCVQFMIKIISDTSYFTEAP